MLYERIIKLGWRICFDEQRGDWEIIYRLVWKISQKVKCVKWILRKASKANIYLKSSSFSFCSLSLFSCSSMAFLNLSSSNLLASSASRSASSWSLRSSSSSRSCRSSSSRWRANCNWFSNLNYKICLSSNRIRYPPIEVEDLRNFW